MRIVVAAVLGFAAATAALPAVATVMIAEPARQPTGCFDSVGPCEPQGAVVAAAPNSSEPPAPIIPAVVGILALGLAFMRRQSVVQEVVC